MSLSSSFASSIEDAEERSYDSRSFEDESEDFSSSRSGSEEKKTKPKPKPLKNNGVAYSVSNNYFQQHKNGPLVVLFFKEECPYCRELKPTWNKVAKLLPQRWPNAPKVVRMDMTKFSGVKKSIGFPTVPMIAMYKPKKPVVFVVTKDRLTSNLIKIIEDYYKNDKLPRDVSEYKIGLPDGRFPLEEQQQQQQQKQPLQRPNITQEPKQIGVQEQKPRVQEVKTIEEPVRQSTISNRKSVAYTQQDNNNNNNISAAVQQQTTLRPFPLAVAASAQTQDYSKAIEDVQNEVKSLKQEMASMNQKMDEVITYVEKFLQQKGNANKPETDDHERIFGKLLETLVRNKNKL